LRAGSGGVREFDERICSGGEWVDDERRHWGRRIESEAAVEHKHDSVTKAVAHVEEELAEAEAFS